ncbi:hypothetical protein BJ508DRAFT_417505 [Ascobolus immersus RN42]|uniref:Uncharacterized protein n=1 Tax=Ascobolus immersus RN42 TaxID=1160509 RepID=A0A3N4HTG4_ASCIM|nr:hypothetical protein BJ508DRAFT_417505 [Ascobolus immersus RN42]
MSARIRISNIWLYPGPARPASLTQSRYKVTPREYKSMAAGSPYVDQGPPYLWPLPIHEFWRLLNDSIPEWEVLDLVTHKREVHWLCKGGDSRMVRALALWPDSINGKKKGVFDHHKPYTRRVRDKALDAMHRFPKRLNAGMVRDAQWKLLILVLKFWRREVANWIADLRIEDDSRWVEDSYWRIGLKAMKMFRFVLVLRSESIETRIWRHLNSGEKETRWWEEKETFWWEHEQSETEEAKASEPVEPEVENSEVA